MWAPTLPISSFCASKARHNHDLPRNNVDGSMVNLATTMFFETSDKACGPRRFRHRCSTWHLPLRPRPHVIPGLQAYVEGTMHGNPSNCGVVMYIDSSCHIGSVAVFASYMMVFASTQPYSTCSSTPTNSMMLSLCARWRHQRLHLSVMVWGII